MNFFESNVVLHDSELSSIKSLVRGLARDLESVNKNALREEVALRIEQEIRRIASRVHNNLSILGINKDTVVTVGILTNTYLKLTVTKRGATIEVREVGKDNGDLNITTEEESKGINRHVISYEKLATKTKIGSAIDRVERVPDNYKRIKEEFSYRLGHNFIGVTNVIFKNGTRVLNKPLTEIYLSTTSKETIRSIIQEKKDLGVYDYYKHRALIYNGEIGLISRNVTTQAINFIKGSEKFNKDYVIEIRNGSKVVGYILGVDKEGFAVILTTEDITKDKNWA